MAPSVTKKGSSPEYAYYDKIAEIKRQMPIGWVYIVGSFIIWTIVLWGLYRGVIYGSMHMRMDDSDLNGFCEEDFAESVDENFDRLLEIPKGDSWPYLPVLGLSSKKQRKSKQRDFSAIAYPNTLEFPPIVTAVISEDFLAVQGLVQQIKSEVRPLFDDPATIKFIVYDMGLTTSEKEVLTLHCGCLVRSVDEKKFPVHVFDWTNYSWKAVLIQLILKEFGSALWVNPWVRLNADNLKPAEKVARENDLLVWPEIESPSVLAYTNPLTFQFYKEARCPFKDTVFVDSSAMFFYATDFTLRGVMTPWLKCVLTESCVVPLHSTQEDCLHKRAPQYTGCHRYDQSALSIVINRLLIYSENIDKYTPQYRLAEKAKKYIEYFPERPWTRRHRNYVIYGVILTFLCMTLASIFGPLFLECLGIRFRIKTAGSSA